MNGRIFFLGRSPRRWPVRVVQQGAAAVNEIDGSIGHGTLHVVRVSLRPMEVQILRRAAQ
jgi:hypothetical protein